MGSSVGSAVGIVVVVVVVLVGGVVVVVVSVLKTGGL